MDGFFVPFANYIMLNMQNAYYEGYTGYFEVKNWFLYNFRGAVTHAALVYLVCWHDRKLVNSSGLMRNYLSDSYTPPGFAILEDTVFQLVTTSNGGKILRARKSNETQDILSYLGLSAIDPIMQRAMRTKRQSAEEGIRLKDDSDVYVFPCLEIVPLEKDF